MKMDLEMVSKDFIDDYFVNNYNKLDLAVIKIQKNNNNFGFDSCELLSSLYEHLLVKIDKITPKNIESYCIRFISSQIKWSESEFNKMIYGKKSGKLIFVETVYEIEDEQDDFEYKIRMEVDYNEKKNILFDFRKTLSQGERIFYDEMYKGGSKITIKELQAKFKINRGYIIDFRSNILKKQEEFIKLNYKK